MDASTINCSLSVEEISSTGNVLKKTQHKNIKLTLGRNEFRDVILKVDYGKKEMKYTVKDVIVHKKFVKDGKATIKLPDHKVQFMLANCPPDKLVVFLKTMTTKFECLKKGGFVGERRKLFSELPRTFQEISPLTIKELQNVQNIRTKLAESKLNQFTPKMKRKRCDLDDEKENIPPGGRKIARTSLSTRKVLNPVKLNKEQTRVMNAVLARKNVFFTGSAGTGKSFLMKRIIGALPPEHTFATASTGVAACHIGGTTLHSFAGIGSGKASLEQCIQLASRSQVAQQWKRCNHLIIDEVSMVDGDYFSKLETVARVVKKNDSPFGGIQLIVCGDFLQLPPVTKDQDTRKFCFQTRAWWNSIHVNIELPDVRRQSDVHFINVLQEIRLGRCPDFVDKCLKQTAKNDILKDGILASRLCTHKEDVDKINEYHIQKLQGLSKEYVASDSDDVYTQQIDTLCPVSRKLVLKVGAQVMLAKNLDVQKGLVNGSRGVIKGFEKGNTSLPIVKFLAVSGEEVVKPVRWTFKAASGIYLTRKQIPLKLAWAISIHKSQGMTLDCVEISLSRVFESGQAYVALSRAKSLEGLRVLDFDRSCVRANPEVLKFYHKLKLSQKLAEATTACQPEVRPKHW